MKCILIGNAKSRDT